MTSRHSDARHITCLGALIAIGLCSALVAAPLFSDQLFVSHEKESLPWRVMEMAAAIRDGHLPVRWLPNLPHYFGSPFFNFYAPLAYYLATSIHLAGVPLVMSVQILFWLSLFLSGLAMYVLAASFCSQGAALLAAVSYMFAPYRLVEVYVRGALAETFACIFLPLVLFLSRKLFIRPRRWDVPFLAVTYAAVVLSHNITALLFSGIVVLYLFFLSVSERNWKPLIPNAVGLGLGLGLSSFFWLPALAETEFTSVQQMTRGYMDLSNHFVFLSQLVDPSFGFGASVAGRGDGMSFQVGLVQAVFSLLALAVICSSRPARQLKASLIFFVFLTLACVFLMNSASLFAWRALPLLSFVQFPWRLLVFVALAMSVTVGIVASEGSKLPNWRTMFGEHAARARTIAWLGLLVLLVCVPFSWAAPGIRYVHQDQAGNEYVVGNAFFTLENLGTEFDRAGTIGTTYGEYMPPDLTRNDETRLLKRTGRDVVRAAQGIRIANIEKRTGWVRFDITANAPGTVEVEVMYFPGWQVYVDGRKAELDRESPFIAFDSPTGEHHVEVVFEDTPVRHRANLVSIASMLLLVVVAARPQHFGNVRAGQE